MASRQTILSIALEAESLGFDSLWVHDHISYDADWVEHRTSGLPGSDDEWRPRFFDSLMTLAYVAGVTDRVKLGTAVLVLPLRDPRLLARQTLTLQALSNGRLLLGVGIGDYPADFEVMGISYRSRASLTDEYLEVLAAIYPGGESSFRGPTVVFESAVFLPKVESIPIFVGGGISHRAQTDDYKLAEPPLRRLARWGSGWIPEGPPDHVAAGIERIRALSHEYGRESTTVDVSVASPLFIGADTKIARSMVGRGRDYELVGTIDTIVHNVDSYQAAGASGIIVRCWASDVESYLVMIKEFAREVMPRFIDVEHEHQTGRGSG